MLYVAKFAEAVYVLHAFEKRTRRTPKEDLSLAKQRELDAPPVGHDVPLRTIVDESLRRFDTVWCAAGTPNAVFSVRTDELIAAISAAEVRAVAAHG